MLLGNHEAQNSQISDIPLFVLLTCCVYVNILFPEPFHLLSLSLSPSLSDECQWNKMHFKALWSFHTIIFLQPSLGNLFFFLLVCSAAGIGKEKEKNKTSFNVIFELLFPSPLPGASLCFALSVLSHLAWISCHLSWLPPAQRDCPLIPDLLQTQGNQEISAPELDEI